MTPDCFIYACSYSNFAVMKIFSGKLAIFNSILILLVPVLTIVDSSDKIRLVPDDPRGVVGESLQMWCSVSSTSGLKSSDLELLLQLTKKRLIAVDSRFVHIVNETTVEMNYLDLPLIFNNAVVICRLNSSRRNQTETTKLEPHDMQILQVGYRPFKPYIFKDYKVYNWDHFTFSWYINETDPVYLTRYEAWYKSKSALDYTSCSASQKLKQQGSTCKIEMALDLVHPDGYLWFKVNGSNAVGQITSDIAEPDLHHRIQPGKVRNVTVSSSVSNGVVAEFYSPIDEQVHLKYRISVACGNATWPIIMIKNHTSRSSKSPVRWKIQHVLPPFTKCHLSVSCLPFHNRQYWSDWSENVSFTSPDGFPLVGPQLCCFEIDKERQNGIKLYYKNLTERQAQGEVVAYHVHFNVVTSGSQMNFTGAKEINLEPNKLFFSLDINKETSYILSVSAQTRAGRNMSAVSSMPLIQDEILPLPQNMTAIWYGSRIVTVSWRPLEGKLFDYTVVWCKGLRQCERPVDWEITSDSSYNVQLPPDETHLSYRFGIVVGGGSSGIEWLKCIYNISAGASAPDVYISNTTSSAVSLRFREPGCDIGYIYAYKVYYMKNGENVSFIQYPHQLKSADWNVVIDHLEPESNYCFRVVALTYNGPSEEEVIDITTDRSGKLMSWQLALISIGAVLGFFFIGFGIYSCCRWNQKQILKFRKWLNMDITIPRQQTLDNRGSADGGHLSSSYTSLTKTLEPLLLVSDTLHAEQVKNSSDVKDEQERVFTAAGGTSSVVQDTRPVTEGDSASLPPTVKNSSGPNERLLVISEDSCNSIVLDPKLDQSRVILVNRSMSSAGPQSSSASEKSIGDQLVCKMSADKKSIPKDTKSVVLQNLEPNLSLIQQPKHSLSGNNNEVSSSSVPNAQAAKRSSISLAGKHRIGSAIGHSSGDGTGCVNDGTTCCGIDRATGSTEESNPVNRTLLASTAETESDQTDGADLISQHSMRTSGAGHLGNVVTSLSNYHLDASDEVEDYSNVRIADPSSEHIESSAEIYGDGYSVARPPAADDEIADEDSDNGYSNATLMDDVDYHLVSTEAQPVHDESAEDEEGQQDSDNYYSGNYSRASIIRRPQ